MKRIVKSILAGALVIALVMAHPQSVAAEKNETECHVISIAIDVSGSMKKTDSQKHSLELIKLFMDLCSEEDYLCVTAYNDQIVYHSGLVSMGSATEKEMLVKALDELQFQGETDNGLGLLTATNAIVETAVDYDNAFIIFVSDGNTDLVNSKTDRTTADSDADMRASAELAIEKDIVINVVEYTDSYNQDTGLLSVVSTSTGGSTTIVDNAPQFVQVLLGTFFAEYEQGRANLQILESSDTLQRYEKAVELEDNQRYYEVLFSTEPIVDCEVINATDAAQVFRGKHYLIQRLEESGKHDIKAIYSVEKPTVLISGAVRITQESMVTPEPSPTPMVVVDKGKTPVGQDIIKQIYTSNAPLVMDVSSLFMDADGDIVKYSVVQEEGDAACSLSGSMLTIELVQDGKNRYEITAIDSKQNQTELELLLEVVPAWMKYQHIITIAIICAILLCASGISVYIIRRVLFGHKKVQKAISGNLRACFIDLKSKNESVDIDWNLREYPPEGVTLEELLLSKGVRESFQDMDKICFYPGKNSNELLLVHCMEGGIFLGEQNVKANTPTTVCSGDVLYISFAENASEIELKYTTTY